MIMITFIVSFIQFIRPGQKPDSSVAVKVAVIKGHGEKRFEVWYNSVFF